MPAHCVPCPSESVTLVSSSWPGQKFLQATNLLSRRKAKWVPIIPVSRIASVVPSPVSGSSDNFQCWRAKQGVSYEPKPLAWKSLDNNCLTMEDGQRAGVLL